MDEFDQAGPLAVALNELSLLGSAQDRETIASLRDRLASRRLRVLVAGEAKRGKSTLVNALLGRPLLPTGALPLTALATTPSLPRATANPDPAAMPAMLGPLMPSPARE